MWKVLKRVINKKGKCNLVDKITVKNTEITNKQKILDEMNEYFVSIGGNLAEGIPEGVDESLRATVVTQKSRKFLAGKFPMLFCLLHAFLIIIVQEPNTLRPRGFSHCVNHLVHIR